MSDTEDNNPSEIDESVTEAETSDKKTMNMEEISQDATQTETVQKDVQAIYDIPVQISAVLGKSSMQVNQLLKLGRGAVVELDRRIGEAVDIYVNDRLVARGEVVIMEDRLGVTMTEILKSDQS